MKNAEGIAAACRMERALTVSRLFLRRVPEFPVTTGMGPNSREKYVTGKSGQSETAVPFIDYAAWNARCNDFPVDVSKRRKTRVKMPGLEFKFLCVLLVGGSIALSGQVQNANAFDPSAGVTKESGPFDLFKFGFQSYKLGNKQDALEAYRYAAEKGHTGSRWALATMYSKGDGVVENDYEAFKIYSEIASQGVEPGSEDTGYFVNALMALANYYYAGIPDSPVGSDVSQARALYFQAASAFGNAEAQFRLAKMLLSGEGGEINIRQAKKWLNHARRAGHAGAMGMFGNVLFQEGQTVRGLAFMTAALDSCEAKCRAWLQPMQEQAFSLVAEEDRRVAIALSAKIRIKGAE